MVLAGLRSELRVGRGVSAEKGGPARLFCLCFVFRKILDLFDPAASAKIMSVFSLKVVIQNGSAWSWSPFAF